MNQSLLRSDAAGLTNGVLLRTEVDHVTGQLSDTRTRFLGTRPPKVGAERSLLAGCCPQAITTPPCTERWLSAGMCAVLQLLATAVNGRRSMLALSSRAWLGYSDQGRYNLSPLSFEALDYASSALPDLRQDGFPRLRVVCCCIVGCLFTTGVSSDGMLAIPAGFASEQCPEGFVAVVKSSLRILMLERLGETFNQTSVPLRYTPRGFAIDEANKVRITRCFCCLFFRLCLLQMRSLCALEPT